MDNSNLLTLSRVFDPAQVILFVMARMTMMGVDQARAEHMRQVSAMWVVWEVLEESRPYDADVVWPQR